MRFSLIIAAASSATALPLLGLDKLPVVSTLLNGGIGNIGNTDSIDPTSTIGPVHIVWTNVKATGLKTLSILNGPATELLGHVCADKLVGDIVDSVPVDFGNVHGNGVGSFILDGVVYPVANTLTGAAAVHCVTDHDDVTAVLDCVVPQLKGVANNLLDDVKDTVSCLADKVPIVSDLDLLQKLPGLNALPDLDIVNYL